MSDGRIDSIINAKKCNDELESVYAAMGKIAELIVKVNELGKNLSLKGFKEGFDAMKQAESGLRELNKAKEEAVRAESALQQALLESKKINQDLKNELDALRLAEAKRREEARKRKEEIKGEKGSIIDLREQLKRLQQMWDSYGAASRRANKGTLDEIKRVSTELKKLEAETGRHQRNVGNYPQVVGGLSGLLGSFGVTLGGGAIAKQVFDTTVQIDSLNAALKVVSGSEREYAKNQAFLADTSERLGLNVLDLTQAYKLFFAASTQSGLSADETRKIFNSVAETAANLKLSQENTNGVLLAFSQILGKGKVQAEELRGQIGERVPGAFAIAARSIGKTEAELNKMLEKGEVVASEFLPKFAAELEKTYGISNTARVNGLQAAINRLHDTFVNMVKGNEGNLAGFFTSLILLATAAAKALDGLITKIQDVGHGVSRFLDRTIVGSGLNNILDPLGIFDTNEDLEKSLARDKNRQDKMNKALDELAKKRPEDQAKLIALFNDRAKVARDRAIEAKKTYGEASKEFIAAVASQAYLEDLALAAQQQLDKSNTTKATASKGPTKKELDAAARLKELQLKAEMEARKIDLEDAVESQKEIFENEKIGWEDRLLAAETYYNLKNILAKESADGEKKILDVEISRGRATAAQKVTVDKKAAAEQAANRRELGKILKDITKSSTDEETKAIIKAGEKRQADIKEQGQAEMAATQKAYKDRKISKDQYEVEKLRIENKYQILSLQAELEYTEEVLKLMRLRGQDTGKQEQELLDLRNKIRDLDLEYTDKSEKEKTEITKAQLDKRKKLQEEYASKVKELVEEAVDFAGALGDSIYEREKNQVQGQIDDIDRRKEAEIAAVNASTATAEDKAHQISIIESQAQVQRESLERRQREIDARAASFQKFMSLLQIGITTAEAVVKIQAQAAVLASNPVTAALAGLAYAQIPIVIATGALQAAAIAAKPIPRYKDGTEDHPGGPAYVNDGGRLEVLESPDGKAYVPYGRNVLMDIPAHYKVHPSIDDYLSAAGAATMRPLPAIDGSAASVDKMTKAVLDGFDKQTDKILDGLERSKTSIHINNSPLGVRATVSKAAQKMRWLNHEFDL